MLSSYRVLDLTDHRGIMCGYLLAHLDADVIAVEPPGGSNARRTSAFSQNKETELWWQAYGRGKRSIVLDLESAAGRDEFDALVAEADFLIESYPRETAKRFGIDYARLSARNPGLIMVSISAFGRTGPKADWPATDLTVWASSCAHVLTGDADRPPVRPSVPQAFAHAGADAAGAALVALQERHKSGLGQHIDISAQRSSAQATLGTILVEPNNGGLVVQREAGGVSAVFPIQLTWPCKDGYVAVTFMFGVPFDEPNKRLLRWACEYGACSTEEAETDWGTRVMGMFQEGDPPEPYFDLCKKIERFTMQLTQQELFDQGMERGVYIAPILDVEGLLGEPHFQARDYWTTLSPTSVRAPGAFAKLSKTPLTLPGKAPPLDSAEHRGWLADRVPSSSPTSQSDLPLAGLKVLDFMWVAAGPYFTRVLADYGATVIKLESNTKMDAARGLPGFKNGEVTLDSSSVYNTINAGKLGITVDPSNPVGREVIIDLVRWADVVTESFSPKAMRQWGLDYDSLKEINPEIIMLSSCLMGQTGPRAQLPGFGNMAAAIAGFYDSTGWSDRSPAGPYGAYTDTVAPRFALIALMAAIEHRKRTGEGQYIDISQAEASIHFLAPAILDFEQSGNVPRRMGNVDGDMCPHAVYGTAGEDRWIAIACEDDGAWLALREMAGLPDDADLLHLAGRKEREQEIDILVSRWCETQEGSDLQALLIEAGVAAHIVQNSAECMRDPHLIETGYFRSVEHTVLGEFFIDDSRFTFSRTPAQISKAGPELGEHNFQVLGEVLGYDADRIADIYAALAME